MAVPRLRPIYPLLVVCVLSAGVVLFTALRAPRAAAPQDALVPSEVRLQLRLAAQLTAACGDVLHFTEALLGFGRSFWEEAGALRSASLIASVGWQAREGALVDAVDCWEGRGCVPDRFFSDAVRSVHTALPVDDAFRPRWEPVSGAFLQAEDASLRVYETFRELQQRHPQVVAQTLQQLRDVIWSAAQQRTLDEIRRALIGQTVPRPSH